MHITLSSWLRPAIGPLAALLAFGAAAPTFAQGTYSLAPPVVGSGSVADADPPVIRPSTQPCKVQLFTGFQFNGYATQTFPYAPPKDCAGPWAKVVFVADFSVDGTNQFDRTAEIQLGDTMIYFGTTQEPSPTEQPTWHVESDLTDYTALFKTDQPGTVELGNTVNSTYNGTQTGSAYLEFYPADWRNPAPRTADQVLPLPQTAGAQTLNTTADSISETFTLPENVEQAYLDVFTQGQSNDEFWWSCIPNDALALLGASNNCGNTAFRQAEVSVDGKPAGLAPIYPYIFTGGVDPDLWRPIPGVQTLNFKPYRVDLTPFAGQLSNGQTHTVSVNVYNADSYFQADATLLLFQDHGSKKVTGGLTSNTLGATPVPTENENLGTYAATGNGSIVVTDAQSYKIAGYVNTSHGKVSTVVDSSLKFSNSQLYTATSEVVKQLTLASQKSTTQDGWLSFSKAEELTFPLTYTFTETINPDNSGSETIAVDQKLTDNTQYALFNYVFASSTITDEVKPVDKLVFDASGNLTSEPIDTNTETYIYKDTEGHCWDRTLSAKNALVSAVSDGKGCPGGENRWQ